MVSNCRIIFLHQILKIFLIQIDDVLTDDKGECVICFEILEKGQTIARLPCLCIYHKGLYFYIITILN